MYIPYLSRVPKYVVLFPLKLEDCRIFIGLYRNNNIIIIKYKIHIIMNAKLRLKSYFVDNRMIFM